MGQAPSFLPMRHVSFQEAWAPQLHIFREILILFENLNLL